jgi:DNA-binding NarL/FixJ family response regulator
LLTEAVRAAAAGDVLISPQVTVRLLKTFRGDGARATPSTDRTLPPLTGRETEIARLVAQGRSNAQIAATLFLSPGTVKNHLATIQRKVDAPNRVGVAAWVWSKG